MSANENDFHKGRIGKYLPVRLEGDKIVLSSSMREIEAKSIQEGAGTDEAYMQKAAWGISRVVLDYIDDHQLDKQVILLCAKGNNSGDAYATAKILLEEGHQIVVYQLIPLEECSPLCKKFAEQCLDLGAAIHIIQSADEIEFAPERLVIDGLLGTGFKGEAKGLMHDVIQRLNNSFNRVISIDVPSGVSCDDGMVHGEAVRADKTVYLGMMKVGALYGDGFEHVGDLHYVDFGLPEKYIQEVPAFAYFVNPDIVRRNLPILQFKRAVNKYEVGQALIVAGSRGMPGAAMLACLAALRSGVGIVRLFHPKEMEAEFAAAPYELVRCGYTKGSLEELFAEMSRSKALLLGSGMGRSPDTEEVIDTILAKTKLPCVIDGDALFFFKQCAPDRAILTPHTGELRHLLGVDKTLSDLDLITKAQEFVEKHRVVMIFKGPPMTILAPGAPSVVAPWGNKGMASAGMGDALAGIVVSLLAQGLDLRAAAVLGATLHVMAGDIAKERQSMPYMLATDLIEALSHVFLAAMD